MTEASEQRLLNVLFLGGRNVARSIMAEAILNREGIGRYRAFSAGCEPGGDVHPATLELCQSWVSTSAGWRPRAG
jgi:protein-tyrosine-phosphatase